jgi:xanthine dehydrogenase accessory factor
MSPGLPEHPLVHADGGARAVLRAALAAQGASPVLGVVLEVLGASYVTPGSLCLFAGGERRAGWLSGGCLEPGLATLAAEQAASPRLLGVELDQREDAALLAPSAPGCRGRLRLALIPLGPLAGWQDVVERWLAGCTPLSLHLDAGGRLRFGDAAAVELPVAGMDWPGAPAHWTLSIPAAPRAWLCGAGPEAAVLIPLLQSLGWCVEAIDSRERWRGIAALADRHHPLAPEQAACLLASIGEREPVLVMHHDFERDRAALAALAAAPASWIGLLGPARRRDDLFRLLPAAAVQALAPRLQSPVGLDLGGKGPAHIALSIAAELCRWRHPRGG